MAEDILKLMMMATYVILLTTTFITHPWLPRHILPTYTIFNLVLGPTPNMDYGKKKLMAGIVLVTFFVFWVGKCTLVIHCSFKNKNLYQKC
jgi:hypothetical protein